MSVPRCRALLGEIDADLQPARTNAGFDLFDEDSRSDDRRLNTSFLEASDLIVDIREYDVPYHVRVMIDLSKPLAVRVAMFRADF